MKAVVHMATPFTLHWKVKVGSTKGSKNVRGVQLAGTSPPFLGRERAAVGVDVDPERPSPRYHEACLALDSVEDSSAAVLQPRCVGLHVLVVQNLKEACRLPVRVQKPRS